ncbi:MAG: CRISPR-associated endonuclease Cas2 [bacterium]|uniref:CRISPR-associated endoribonuclease Cas2 n=2 Tax=Bacteria candidate phyla TaxID=1783234 RepID=A0A117M664_UNCT6|nr:MAG: Putative CRISPR-associated (Cas) protein (Cas2 family) [candidate division TA06 bacterium 32_111]KUK86532.1 MAG: Putative CRISPR-associated (Cas) protein (Cas2 family) [candidate division TA06 bacterium 34_109]MDI6700734.1 CRISPR-associated endonuclease Cas2 [bacterium]HAF07881.1 CRISPR-associated endonuclease Cas2 [candidate division WOR-3 bacterium]HCP16417.1 CRISPR-associated endonuclease Cas2 [candidate division WOR-3 bacterium]
MKRKEIKTPNNRYHSMWLLALFDLPTETKEDRRNYREFRNSLLKEGFEQLQYSVYARYVGDEKRAETFKKKIRNVVPPKGEVRIISLTDIQFGKMEIYYQNSKRKPEEKLDQLLLF